MASVSNSSGNPSLGRPKIGGDVTASNSVEKAVHSASPKVTKFTDFPLVKSLLRGPLTSEKPGTKRQYALHNPRKDLSFVCATGCFACLSDGTRVSSTERWPERMICPSYFTEYVKDLRFFNVRVIPASGSTRITSPK